MSYEKIYYITLRNFDLKRAELFKDTIARYPVTIVEANKELILKAACHKAYNKISYADAFAAALAKMKKAVLVTGNKEFKVLEGEIKIHWL